MTGSSETRRVDRRSSAPSTMSDSQSVFRTGWIKDTVSASYEIRKPSRSSRMRRGILTANVISLTSSLSCRITSTFSSPHCRRTNYRLICTLGNRLPPRRLIGSYAEAASFGRKKALIILSARPIRWSTFANTSAKTTVEAASRRIHRKHSNAVLVRRNKPWTAFTKRRDAASTPHSQNVATRGRGRLPPASFARHPSFFHPSSRT